MAKGLAPVFFTACGVVVAGVVAYAVFDIQPSINQSQSVVSENTSKESVLVKPQTNELKQEFAKLNPSTQEGSNNGIVENAQEQEEPTVPVTTETPAEKLPVKPTFGLVRVERDGSAVIAGEGPANEVVELIDGSKKLGETKITAAGEFVFVLDEPLTPGAHELFLRVRPKDGKPSLSSSFAFIDVPKPKTIGEVTVLLAEAGKPSQLLQKPQSSLGNDSADTETNTVTATAQSKITLAKPVEKDVQDVDVDEPKQTELSQPKKTEIASLSPVLIEAADVENGKIFIAGTGEPLTSINIYLENDLLGSTQVAENGAFLFEGSTQLKPGRYDIRADMTKGGASVLARAEVTLVHEPNVVADIAKEEPKLEPKEEVANLNKTVEEKIEVETEVKTEAEQTASIEEPELAEPAAKLNEDKKEIQTGSAVIIRRGDSLWKVARRNYGAGIRYTTIFDANRDQVRDPHRIYPGQVLKIPETEQATQ